MPYLLMIIEEIEIQTMGSKVAMAKSKAIGYIDTSIKPLRNSSNSSC
tara:strand:- start:19 stop:159 length:141 start_codon:yes stop_codon:yes gene_type:complete